MTEATIALDGVIILAALGVVAKTLDYVNKSVFPQIKTLFDNVTALEKSHALNQQQTDQNTARLNGLSARTETLMMASPGTNSASVNVNAGAPGNVIVETAPAPADAPAEAPAEAPGPAAEVPVPVEAPRPIHVTISADAPFSASDLAAAHVALDAQVLGAQPAGGLSQ